MSKYTCDGCAKRFVYYNQYLDHCDTCEPYDKYLKDLEQEALAEDNLPLQIDLLEQENTLSCRRLITILRIIEEELEGVKKDAD